MAFALETEKKRIELQEIQRELDGLQDDLGDLREKFEDEEEEARYEAWVQKGGKQTQLLAETEMAESAVEKQPVGKNTEIHNPGQEAETLNVNNEIDSKKDRQGSDSVGVLCTEVKGESSGDEIDDHDFAKRITKLRKRMQRPSALPFNPSFFERRERGETLSLLNPGALSTAVTPCVHRRPIVTSTPIGTVPRNASGPLTPASTKPEVVESGGGDINLDVWKWEDSSTESEESGQEDNVGEASAFGHMKKTEERSTRPFFKAGNKPLDSDVRVMGELFCLASILLCKE